MRFNEPRPGRRAPIRAAEVAGAPEAEPIFDVREQVPPELADKLRNLIKRDLEKDIADVTRDLFLHLDTFHLLFPDQQLTLTPSEVKKVLQILTNRKQRMEKVGDATTYGWFAEELAAVLPEIPEARRIYPSAGMRRLLWKPDEAKYFVEERDVEPWIQFLGRLKENKIGDVGSVTLSKSFLVLSFLRPELKPRLRSMAERLVANGAAHHGFSLPHDIMRVWIDLRIVFPDLSLPDQPYRTAKQGWIQGWERQVRQDKPDPELLNNYTGTAIFLTGERFYLDETGKVRYSLNRPLNQGKALPMREAI